VETGLKEYRHIHLGTDPNVGLDTGLIFHFSTIEKYDDFRHSVGLSKIVDELFIIFGGWGSGGSICVYLLGIDASIG